MSGVPDRLKPDPNLAQAVFGGGTPRDTFIKLLTHHFWPVAIYPKGTIRHGEPSEGKDPIGKAWGEERWTLERANETFKRYKDAGVGICLGPGRALEDEWLIDIEGDGPEAEASRAMLMGGEQVATLGWKSARGGHGLHTADPERLADIMPRLKALEGKGMGTGVYKSPALPGLELRIGGYKPDGTVKQLQSVVPPTRGTDGQPRCWTGPVNPAPVPGAFYTFMEGLAEKACRESAPTPTPRSTPDQNGRWTPEARATAYLQACDPAISGQSGHKQAFKTACKVGPGFDLAPDTAFRLLREVWNPTCEPPWSDAELQHKVDEAYKVENQPGWLLNEDRKPTGSNGQTNGKHLGLVNGATSAVATTPPATDAELGLTDLADVEPVAVEWIWANRIPRGKITLLAGEGGVGKTFLALDLVARISRGGEWPDRPGEAIEAAHVIILTAEDDLPDTIVPRLIHLSADLKRITALGTARLPNGRSSPFTIAEIDRLEEVMGRRPEIRLIVIDPITAFLGRVDDHKNAELRGLLGPLAEFAGKYKVAILAITHFNKGTGTKASSRVMGSVAYSNAARATWGVMMDPENPERRLMLRVKNNLSPDRTGMAYTIKEGRVEWEPTPIELSANDVLEEGAERKKSGPEPRKTVAFARWLWERLQPGPELLSKIIDTARTDSLLKPPTSGNPKPSLTSLYDARKRIPALYAGWEVDEFLIVEGGKERKAWQLAKTVQESLDSTNREPPY